MENVITKSFGVGLERTFIDGFVLDLVWWIRTRLKFGGLGLDSSLVDSNSTRAFSNGLVIDSSQNKSFSIILSALFASPSVDKVVTVRESLKTWVDFL